MAAEGAKVIICARRADTLEEAAAEIRAGIGGEVLAILTDVTQPEQVKELFEQTIATFGRIDILLNDAGTSAACGFEEVSDDRWRADLDLKLFGAIHCW